jgi:hypothetical protein
MITGNMTLHGKPSENELRDGVICLGCYEQCSEAPVDNSFSDGFGYVTDWGVGSSCCGEEVAEGKIFLHQTMVHVARKDHVNQDGRVIVAKGQRYRKTITKGYYEDPDDGEHHGIFLVVKKALDPQ